MMRSCLVAYVFSNFKRGGSDTFAKWRNLKLARLSSTSVRIGLDQILRELFKSGQYFLSDCHTLPDSVNGRVTGSKILCPFASVHKRFLTVPNAVNAFHVR